MGPFSKMFGLGKQSDWGTTAADKIETFVDSVRDKAVVPIITVARALVYGILILVAGIVALVLMLAGVIRLLNTLLAKIPGVSEGIWVTYILLGTIFLAAGLFLFSKRNAPEADRS